MIETVERQIRRLLKLSNDLLEVSRLASRRPTVEGRRVDLAILVQTVVTHFHFELTKSGSVVNLRATPVVGMWEAAKLEQAVTNLLSNAIKYGRGKRIDITVEEDGPLARLTIRDRGVGIAPDALERIFDRFERADASHNPGGLGLGLYLACQIVQAHGGAITATSELGNGSAFVVELPRRLPA
jgi:signal transduction histidine kinase